MVSGNKYGSDEFPDKAPKKITRLINEGTRVCTATTPRALRAMMIGYQFLEFSHFLRVAFVRGVTCKRSDFIGHFFKSCS